MILLHPVLQSICLSLFLISACFIYMELRARFDRIFLYFGLSLLLLCGFCAVDLWVHPVQSSEYWIKIQHVIFCLFVPFAAWYLLELTKRKDAWIVKSFLSLGMLFSLLFLGGLMTQQLPERVSFTAVYTFLFVPYTLASIVTLLLIAWRGLRMPADIDRRLAVLHIAGAFLVAICGIIDLLRALTGILGGPVSSYTIIGTLFLAVILTVSFTERLVLLIRERLMFIDKLQLSYRELEQAKSLSEIGRSTAIINHEIKNYTCVISGYAQYLQDQTTLDDKHKGMLTTIIDTATKLTDFSHEILNFSKAKALSDKHPLSISSLVERCVKSNLSEHAGKFVIENPRPELMVHGDWRKLEQVFLNLFRNAMEAGANQVKVRLVPGDFVLLVAVEDDGCGCDAEQYRQLFQAFYTTKERGTGLGLATSRSIIEGHGGYMSVTSKNLVTPGTHGLTFNIVFPMYDTPPAKYDNIVFVKEKVEQLAEVIQVFRNVFVIPHVVESADDLRASSFSPEDIRVIAGPHTVAAIMQRNEGYRCFSLVSGSDRVIRVLGSPPLDYEGVFTEEFVLTKLAPPVGLS